MLMAVQPDDGHDERRVERRAAAGDDAQPMDCDGSSRGVG